MLLMGHISWGNNMIDINIVQFAFRLVILTVYLVVIYNVCRYTIKKTQGHLISKYAIMACFGLLAGIAAAIIFNGVHFTSGNSEKDMIIMSNEPMSDTASMSEVYTSDSLRLHDLYNKGPGTSLEDEEKENEKLIQKTLEKYQ